MTSFRFILGALCVMALCTPALAADPDLVWYQCATDAECTVISGSCSGSWTPVNRKFVDEATAWTQKQKAQTSCTSSNEDGSTKPSAGCVANKCMIKKGE